MRRTNGQLGANIALQTCEKDPNRQTDKLNLAKRITQQYISILAGKPVDPELLPVQMPSTLKKLFLDRAIQCIETLEIHSGEYMTVPLNLLLWLYQLGSDAQDSVQLYTKLGQGILTMFEREGTENSINLDAIPISDTAKQLIQRWNTELRLAKNRKFNVLQSLMTALAFSVYQRKGGHHTDPFFEHEHVHKIITAAAPLFQQGLMPIFDKEENRIRVFYSMTYNRIGKVGNTYLLATSWSYPITTLVKLLIYRAAPLHISRTKRISREMLINKILSYMYLSRNNNLNESVATGSMFGNEFLW